jgi:hypothetical protein
MLERAPTDMEMSGLVWAVKKLRPYMERAYVWLITDHKPNVDIFDMKTLVTTSTARSNLRLAILRSAVFFFFFFVVFCRLLPFVTYLPAYVCTFFCLSFCRGFFCWKVELDHGLLRLEQDRINFGSEEKSKTCRMQKYLAQVSRFTKRCAGTVPKSP